MNAWGPFTRFGPLKLPHLSHVVTWSKLPVPLCHISVFNYDVPKSPNVSGLQNNLRYGGCRFFVDDTPIRTFKNNEANGMPFPNKQAMGVYTSIWDGSIWATEGGRIKINWASAPFIATYTDFNLVGCTIAGSTTVQSCQSSTFAAPGIALQTLSPHMINQLMWVKKYHVHYNYCTDKKRFQVPPTECTLNIL